MLLSSSHLSFVGKRLTRYPLPVATCHFLASALAPYPHELPVRLQLGCLAPAVACRLPLRRCLQPTLYLPPQLPQNKLGGGEGVEGLYGSIKRSGMDKVGL